MEWRVKTSHPPATDANLKKNMAMVNKLKQSSLIYQQQPQSPLITDLIQLKCQKFLGEMGQSLLESVLAIQPGKSLKVSDFRCILEILAVLKQRSGESGVDDPCTQFMHSLLKFALVTSSSPVTDAKQESVRQGQLRVCLCVLSEMVLCGLTPVDMLSFLGPFVKSAAIKVVDKEQIKSLNGKPGCWTWFFLSQFLQHDLEKHSNAHLAVVFAKLYNSEYLTANEIIHKDVTSLLKDMFEKYFESASTRLVKMNEAIQKMKRYNQDYQITRGELSEQQKQRFENAVKSFGSLKEVVEILASSLNMTVPNLKLAVASDATASATIVDLKAQAGGEKDFINTPWEDEEMASFYTDLVDLKNFVPAIYLTETQVTKKKKRKETRKHEDEIDELDGDWLDEADEELLVKIDSVVMADNEDQPSNETQKKKQQPLVSVEVDKVLLELPSCMNAEMVNKAAIEFCTAQHQHREKARAKLIEILIDIPRYRLDILPYYARFMATLQPFMPEVSATVLTALLSEFRRRFKKQHPIHMDHRIKNVRYISELVKFNLAPSHVVFYCVHRLLRPEAQGLVFSNQHAEVLCHLLESCGKFMLKHSVETGDKFKPFMDILKKKARSSNLDQRVELMIENAFLVIDPPADAGQGIKRKPEKLRTPLEWFIRKLLYIDLKSSGNINAIEKTILELPWNQPIEQEVWKPKIADDEPQEIPKQIVFVKELLLKLCTRIWKFKFHRIHLVADLAAGISKARPKFAVQLIDYTLELIRQGLEGGTNYHTYQRRLLTVKYLGELYNYRLIQSDVVLDTLYSFIFFGHVGGRPVRNETPCYLDPSDNYFRVRLICTLLETCGSYLPRSRIDQYLVFFQHYLFCKDAESMPLEVSFMIEDVLHRIRPVLVRLASYEDAVEAISTLEKSVGIEADDNEFVRNEEEPEVASGSDTSDVRDLGPSQAEEDAFANDFQMLMVESMQSRRSERPVNLDLALPTRSASISVPSEDGNVHFAVLTKRSNKSELKTISVPSDSSLAVLNKKKMEESVKVKKQLKQRILELEHRTRNG